MFRFSEGANRNSDQKKKETWTEWQSEGGWPGPESTAPRRSASEGSKAQRRQQMAQTLGEVSSVRVRGVRVGDNQDSFTQPRICD